VTSPFDAIAPKYDRLWSETDRGQSQRGEVWAEIDVLFPPGSTVLDLGCGTGDDAIHLATLAIQVVGIDSSAEMAAIANARGVDAIEWPIERLSELPRPFDGAISNFGALNCVEDLGAVAWQLYEVLSPGAYAAICLMSRFHPAETARFAAALRFRLATRRWSGHATWRGIDVYYPTSRSVRRSFAPWFESVRQIAIGGGDHTLYIFRRRSAC
jgi:ubiquinone/menaquinone biosynthesis C-methylase UbiE